MFSLATFPMDYDSFSERLSILIVCSVPRTNKNVEYNQLLKRSVMPLTQPKTDLAYLRNEKAKAEQKLRSCQHREKILERRMSELNRRERVHRLCTRAGMLESFLVCPGELTDDQVMELLKISFRQPEVVLALAKMVHDVHEKQNVPNPL